MNKKNKKLGIAMVGLGKYSTGQLIPAIVQSESFSLKGIVTGSEEKAQEYSTKYDIPEKNIYNYDNFDSIKGNTDIDIVYIALPNAMHEEYVIRAAMAGKHVITEKPMGTSVKQCERMIKACKDANVELFVGYRLHFEPHHLEAMKLGQTKAKGPIKKIEGSFGFKIEDNGQWRLQKDLAGGGALVDVGIYVIQAARYVVGKNPIAVRNVKLENTIFERPSEVDGDVTWEMEFPDNVIAYCSSSYTKESDKLYVEAEKGYIEISPAYYYYGLQGSTEQGNLKVERINQQKAQMEGIADTIINGIHNRASGIEGLIDVQIIEAIYKSAKTGERVTLEKIQEYTHV
ncbi:MAG: Gfo/Idh/MocA family oxidoreductase [Sporocytophaga sp.]|uniref:Gfo/Idh/MocA family protein n=1 Tax=Sporocytophaga sp. TaxID=2231183 RepID=UPI001B0A7FC7|nr:Gfo/Idh/MocA family oxidoreductase [Sporocytophaga sp.]MBO9702983.1 Gfo/Idh/MocA family oxidoreductase [Sporocytophaga sp.]